MSDFDSLAELRRQRALVHEHLAWLDQQIAAAEESGGSASTLSSVAANESIGSGAVKMPDAASRAPTTSHSPAGSADPRELPPEAAVEAEAIIEQYRRPSGDVARDVRSGCLLYFTLGFVLLGLVIGLLYLAFRH
ncbi:hypothetical protein [Opitutus sp. ER46]|uniref:hypothetical protein n=1 Tax=Opitutus sp. ER46 TaxID=2161864 RepID=UPI000D420AF9|nr:hypothetical protein [Opitutus sp. ER46]PTX94317.1 hypothetical protein DB354_11185 [Opitutus sp. ER46]